MSTYTSTYLPNFANEIGDFGLDTWVGAYWTEINGFRGADVRDPNTLAETVEFMLEGTEGLQEAWVRKVTDTEILITVRCEVDEDDPTPPIHILGFVKVEGVTA